MSARVNSSAKAGAGGALCVGCGALGQGTAWLPCVGLRRMSAHSTICCGTGCRRREEVSLDKLDVTEYRQPDTCLWNLGRLSGLRIGRLQCGDGGQATIVDRTACGECAEEGAQDRAGLQEWGGRAALWESPHPDVRERGCDCLIVRDHGGLKSEWEVRKLLFKEHWVLSLISLL